MDTPTISTISSSRKRVIFSVVAATCQEAGFSNASNYVLDILVQMYISFMNELSKSAKQFCEHSGRTEPLPNDIFMALIEMGTDISSLPPYAFRSQRHIIPTPMVMAKSATPKILQTGQKRPHSTYIPDYLPSFPDSHSYIQTPTQKQLIEDYATLREKTSTQNRDVERGLTRFMARTCRSKHKYSLFNDESLSSLFPLIAIKEDNAPYLSALFPKDQTWEDDYYTERKMLMKKLARKNLKIEVNSNDSVEYMRELSEQLNSEEVEPIDNLYFKSSRIVKDFDAQIN